MQLTKYRKRIQGKVDRTRHYSLEEASALLKELIHTKFDPSVDMHIRLGIDPTKADQSIRGTVSLPHGTGKTKRVLVLCNPDQEEEAKAAGADYVGLNEYADKIAGGWLDVDVIIATPEVMPKIAKLGRILGPRNLMPNPKSGTVTTNIGETVREVKKGKIAFKVDKQGIVHAAIGKGSFTARQISDNAKELVHAIARMKPASAKGHFFKSITLASTMSPGLKIDTRALGV
ncbi:MAG TPA: 50S ribosomal protein L1 [Chitinophagales bacterium]|nr:50S ribosomal protein L1 [Chitinophagales bacterium]